jgi:TolA-binding protein
VKELNKTFQDLKMEVETMMKSQRETTLKIENLEKESGAIDASITHRIQEIEGRISGAKIPEKILTQQSKKMSNAKRS